MTTLSDLQKMNKAERDALRIAINQTDIREIADRLGMQRDEAGKGYICPKCGSGKGEGHRRSGKSGKGTGMSYDQKRNKLKCFACTNERGIDCIDAIKETHKCEYMEALVIGADLIGWTPNTTSSYRHVEVAQSAKNNIPKQNYTEYLKDAQKALTSDSEGARYLESRNMEVETARKHGIGYDPKIKRLIIPTDNGGYVARDVTGKFNCRVQNSKGCASYPSFTSFLTGNDPVYVVEGWADALAVISAGGRSVSLNSTSNTNKFLEILKEAEQKIPTLILQFDSDDSGEKAQNNLARLLKELHIPYILGTLNLDSKDPADSYAKDADAFREALRADIDKATQDTSYGVQQERKDLFANAFNLMSNSAGYRIPTGIAEIDMQLGGGLFPGFYVVGGRTGSGKTSLAIQLMDGIAKTGREVLYISLEMSAIEIYAKSIARLAKEKYADAPDYASIMEGALNQYPWGQQIVLSYRDQIVPYIEIYEAVGYTSAKKIRKQARNVQEKTGSAPIVIVDYLQIMGVDDSRLTDKQAADANVLGLKQLSRDLDIPVIAISSLNRMSYDNDRNEITESSFKESGGIEYTADVLWGLERADSKSDDAEIRTMRLKLLKQRRGPKRNPVTFEFDAGSSRFSPHTN